MNQEKNDKALVVRNSELDCSFSTTRFAEAAQLFPGDLAFRDQVLN